MAQTIPRPLAEVFVNYCLKLIDIKTLAILFKNLVQIKGEEKCWDLVRIKNQIAGEQSNSFTVTHPSYPLYKGKDMRYLCLAIAGHYPDDKSVLIRKSTCQCSYCINPNHYFYGSERDKKIERWRRKGYEINDELYNKIKEMRSSNNKVFSYRKLASDFNLSMRIIRSICGDD